MAPRRTRMLSLRVDAGDGDAVVGARPVGVRGEPAGVDVPRGREVTAVEQAETPVARAEQLRAHGVEGHQLRPSLEARGGDLAALDVEEHGVGDVTAAEHRGHAPAVGRDGVAADAGVGVARAVGGAVGGGDVGRRGAVAAGEVVAVDAVVGPRGGPVVEPAGDVLGREVEARRGGGGDRAVGAQRAHSQLDGIGGAAVGVGDPAEERPVEGRGAPAAGRRARAIEVHRGGRAGEGEVVRDRSPLGHPVHLGARQVGREHHPIGRIDHPRGGGRGGGAGGEARGEVRWEDRGEIGRAPSDADAGRRDDRRGAARAGDDVALAARDGGGLEGAAVDAPDERGAQLVVDLGGDVAGGSVGVGGDDGEALAGGPIGPRVERHLGGRDGQRADAIERHRADGGVSFGRAEGAGAPGRREERHEQAEGSVHHASGCPIALARSTNTTVSN